MTTASPVTAMEVDFDSTDEDRQPALGLNGKGTVGWHDARLHLCGWVPSKLVEATVRYGLGLGGFGIGIAITSVWLRLDGWLGALSLVPCLLGVLLARWLNLNVFRGKRTEVVVPWDAVADLRIDKNEVSLLAKHPRTAWVVFTTEPAQAAFDAIGAQVEAAKGQLAR